MKPFQIFDISLLQSLFQGSHHKVAQDSHDRYAEEHAEYSGDTSADGNGYDDPERAQTDGLSQDLWSEIETVKLL